MVTTMMLNDNGLTDQVERRSVGSIGAGITVLREGGVDMIYVTEPVWSKEKGNFRPVFNSADWAPHITQTVGIVKTDYLKKNPDKIRAIIEARRKGVNSSVSIRAKRHRSSRASTRSRLSKPRLPSTTFSRSRANTGARADSTAKAWKPC